MEYTTIIDNIDDIGILVPGIKLIEMMIDIDNLKTLFISTAW